MATSHRHDQVPAMAVPFAKMSGSGNDFVVIDARSGLIADEDIAPFTRAVCRRGLGIGADGVVLIDEPVSGDADFRWRYFNADGSIGEMCGNGAMCGARFAVRYRIASPECRFETEAGIVQARVSADARDPLVRIRMTDAGPPETVTLAIAGERHAFASVCIGVPHAVMAVPDADAFSADGFATFGRAVRHHPHFAQAGTNVNVIHGIDRHGIRMRTYERGVEAETLACGTGAVASVIVAVATGLVEMPVRVRVSGGRDLHVEFSLGDSGATDIRLGGDARFVAHGMLDPEGWE